METARSKDGTAIAFERSGAGAALVLVHGTTADRTRWAPIVPALAGRYTVHAVDRRGRGESGDAPAYVMAREAEDIAAVVESIQGPVYVLAHSYGSLCTLEAALVTDRIARLVIYEPPIPTGLPIYPPGVIERLEALLARGERASLIETFFREVVRVPPDEMEMLKRLPNWPARVAAAHTVPRELRADEEYVFEPARFAALRTPTLFLLGGDSPAFLKKATEAAHAAVHGSRIEILAGQQHTAMNTAPELFIEKVFAFLP